MQICNKCHLGFDLPGQPCGCYSVKEPPRDHFHLLPTPEVDLVKFYKPIMQEMLGAAEQRMDVRMSQPFRKFPWNRPHEDQAES